MPTPSERKGLWFLALVAVSGTMVRVWRAQLPPPSAAEAQELARQIGRVDSVRAAGREKRAKKPAKAESRESKAESLQVDLNRATVTEIEALPGIGPSLAGRIVKYRDSVGRFQDLGALCEVRGVGPAMAERLRPLVTFNGNRSPVSDACGSPSKGAGKSRATRRQEQR